MASGFSGWSTGLSGAGRTPRRDLVLEVMHDQAARGHVLVLSESEARRKFPDLVVASLGAERKEKPGGKVTARVLFDGTRLVR